MKRAVYPDEQNPLSVNTPCACIVLCSTEATVSRGRDIYSSAKHTVLIVIFHMQLSNVRLVIGVYHDHIRRAVFLFSTVKNLDVTSRFFQIAQVFNTDAGTLINAFITSKSVDLLLCSIKKKTVSPKCSCDICY